MSDFDFGVSNPFPPNPLSVGAGVSTVPDYESARQRIMADPALRLSFNIEQRKAQRQASDLDVKRYTDHAVIPLILKDIQDNQAHMDGLNQQIVEFTHKLDTPYPLRDIAQLGIGGVLGSGLAALAGGKISDVVGAGQQQAQQAADVDYQNQTNQWGATFEENQRILADLQRQLGEAQTHGQRLSELRINELGHQEDQAHADVEKAKDRFLKADNPGEVEQAAADLQRLGIPVSDQALSDAKQAASLKFHKQDMSDAAQQYAAISNQIERYGGTSGPMASELDSLVSSINERYGTTYPPVIGGPTWKAKNAADQTAYRNRVQTTKENQFKQQLGLKDREVTAHIAEWAANRAFQRERLGIERTRANADMIRATNNQSLEKVASQIVNYQGQLDEVNRQLQTIANDKSLTPSQRKAQSKPLYSKRDSLQTKVQGYKAVQGYIQRQSDADDADLDGTAQPATPPPSGGSVVYNSGGVTITKH